MRFALPRPQACPSCQALFNGVEKIGELGTGPVEEVFVSLCRCDAVLVMERDSVRLMTEQERSQPLLRQAVRLARMAARQRQASSADTDVRSAALPKRRYLSRSILFDDNSDALHEGEQALERIIDEALGDVLVRARSFVYYREGSSDESVAARVNAGIVKALDETIRAHSSTRLEAAAFRLRFGAVTPGRVAAVRGRRGLPLRDQLPYEVVHATREVLGALNQCVVDLKTRLATGVLRVLERVQAQEERMLHGRAN